jgi:hypothetical protein
MTVAHPAGRRCRNGNDDDDDVCSAVAMYGRCCSHAVAGLQLRLRAENTAAVALLASLSVYSSSSRVMGRSWDRNFGSIKHGTHQGDT